MTTNTDFDYDSIEGALTPQQALAALSAEQGDTSGTPVTEETGGAPATPAVTDDQGTTSADSTTAATPAVQEPAADPVLLARDGKHTIPYDTLVKAREGEQHWKAQAEAAQQQLTELQAQAQVRADSGQAPTSGDHLAAQAQAAIDAGADAALFGDFSEEAMADGIKRYVASQVQAQLKAEVSSQVKEHLSQALQPLQAKHLQDASAAHYDAIYSKHPDADSIAQSNEFKEWVNAQPSAVRAAYWGLFEPETGGTADQIVEVFDAFKGAAPKPTTPAAPVKDAANAALASTKTEPPASLSSIPGGHAAGASALDNTADMSGIEMLGATQDMTPQQLEAWLNRQI